MNWNGLYVKIDKGTSWNNGKVDKEKKDAQTVIIITMNKFILNSHNKYPRKNEVIKIMNFLTLRSYTG